jgi:molybdenum cofactor synthesis domain-containing protein
MYKYELFKYITVDNALKIIKDHIKPTNEETISVYDSIGRSLAQDIVIKEDIPIRDISHVDGFAVRTEDIRETPTRLKIFDGEYVPEGKAVFVRTGFPVPEGADAVIPIESTTVEGDTVLIHYKPRKGHEIIPKGVDFKGGEKIFSRGHELRSQDVKLLVDLGFDTVKVYRKPKVAVYPTGDEFLEGSLRESTSYFIKEILKFYGADPVRYNPLPDDPDYVADALSNATLEYDVIVTIGGSSVGKKDQVLKGLRKIGISEPYFRGIKAQPGRVTSLATVNGKPIVMLPGFIQSTFVGMIYVLLPIIRKMLDTDMIPYKPLFRGIVKEDVKVGGKYKPFLRVRFVIRDDKVNESIPRIKILETISSMLSPIVKSSGFIEVPPGQAVIKAGSEVTVYGIRGVFNNLLQ